MKVLDMNIGDKIIFGEYRKQRGVLFSRRYLPEDIAWVKVSENNDFIAADQVETIRFDEAEVTGTNRTRRSHGNNFFPQSNAYNFLNSRAEGMLRKTHPFDEVPSGINHGFLADFSDWEIGLIEERTFNVIVPPGSKKEFGSKPLEVKCLVSLPSAADVANGSSHCEEWDVEREGLTIPEGIAPGNICTRTPSNGSACEVVLLGPGDAYGYSVYASNTFGLNPVIRLRGDAEVVRSGDVYYVDAEKYDATPNESEFESVLTAF